MSERERERARAREREREIEREREGEGERERVQLHGFLYSCKLVDSVSHLMLDQHQNFQE